MGTFSILVTFDLSEMDPLLPWVYLTVSTTPRSSSLYGIYHDFYPSRKAPAPNSCPITPPGQFPQEPGEQPRSSWPPPLGPWKHNP